MPTHASKAMNATLFSMPLVMAITFQSLIAGEPSKFVSVGSDSMNDLMTLVTEAFKEHHPGFEMEIRGIGSSTGIVSMIDDKADLCPSARVMSPEETEKYQLRHDGKAPLGICVAHDFTVIYVNNENPVKQISVPQLARIFAKAPNDEKVDGRGKALAQLGHRIDSWEKLDPGLPPKIGKERIALFVRNASSVSYSNFRMQVLRNHPYDQSCQELPGNSAVANAIADHTNGIGYGGRIFMPGRVKIIPVSPDEQEVAVHATVETVSNGTYPLHRPLLIYLKAKPNGLLKKFLEFALSKEGQSIVGGRRVGNVPLTDEQALNEIEKLK